MGKLFIFARDVATCIGIAMIAFEVLIPLGFTLTSVVAGVIFLHVFIEFLNDSVQSFLGFWRAWND